MKHIIVLGGGFAGIAATIKLTELGHRVTLIERRQKLGGRAFSFTDPTTGDTVDNGQHLFMRCYNATLELLQLLGIDNNIAFQKEFQIEFRHPQNGITTLRLPKNLPPPLNVLAGFLRFGAVGLKDILPLRKLKKELQRELPSDLSVAQWLTQCQQTNKMQEAFWNPLCLAALNEQPHQASAQYLQAVLIEGFFSSADGAHLGYSQLGLSNLLVDAVQQYINQHKQTLQLGSSATQIQVTSPKAIEVHFNNGSSKTPDAIICALPPHALSTLLPPTGFENLAHQLTHFRPSPILSVNLWFDRPCLQAPIIGMLGTQMEWAFNKSKLYTTHDQASPGHITLIASAARSLAKRPHADLIQLAHQELQSIEPQVGSATLQHARVICEHRATQTLPLGKTPPTSKTPHPNLFLAGDWVDTGLPATIESAVRSGFKAAELAHQA